jgi:PAS domain S-box-containing protein
VNEALEKTAYKLTENIPVGTYTMVQPPDGGMGQFRFLSKRFLEMTGLDRAAAIADPMNAFACVHPDDREEWIRKNAYVFEHKLPFCEECRIIVHGKTCWIRAESAPRNLPDGSVVWEGVLTDITAQKEAEAKIARSDEVLRNMLDKLPFAVGICAAGESHDDPGAKIVFVNRRFIYQLGYTVDDIPSVEAWATQAYPDEDYRREVFAWWDTAVNRIRTGLSSSEVHESRARTKNGSMRDLMISAAPLQDKLIIAFQDMTERRKAERLSAEKEELLQEVLQKLSPREYEIFRLIGRGKKSLEISALLGITRHTVQAHRKQISKLLGFRGKKDLVQQAVVHYQTTLGAKGLVGKAPRGRRSKASAKTSA